MDNKLLTRKALPAYGVLFLFVVLGLLALPPLTPASQQLLGSSIFEEGIGVTGQTLTVPISVGVSFSPSVGVVRTTTPLQTTIQVAFGLTGRNLSSVIRISSATVIIDNSTLQGSSQSDDTASIPLNITLDKEFNWDGSASSTITFLQTGSLKGSLEFSVVFTNGTRTSRNTPFVITGFMIFPSNEIQITFNALKAWVFSIVFWAVGVIIFAVWISRIKRRGKPLHRIN